MSSETPNTVGDGDEIEIIELDDLNQVCRLCMSTTHLTTLEDGSLLTDFEDVTAINVEFGEELQVCSTCTTYLNKIAVFRDFVRKCRDIDRTLKAAQEQLLLNDSSELVKIEIRQDEHDNVIATKLVLDEDNVISIPDEATLIPHPILKQLNNVDTLSEFDTVLNADAILGEFTLDENMTLLPVNEEDDDLLKAINSNLDVNETTIVASNVDVIATAAASDDESDMQLLDNKSRKPTCDFCGILVDNLREHRRLNKACQYKCQICDFTSCRNANLQQHVENRHNSSRNESSYQCPFCPTTVKHKISLKRHLLVHECETKQECDICKQFFKSQKALRKHMKVHAAPTLYDYCRKNSALKRAPPIKKEKNEKPEDEKNKELVCTICSEKFSCRALLYNHSFNHKEKLLTCEQCPYRTNRHRSLIDHLKTHTNEKPYKCDICEACFKQRAQLYKHKLIHTDKRFVCADCDKSFTQKRHLEEHARRHKKLVSVFCHLCRQGFYSVTATKRHIRQIHGVREVEHFVQKEQISNE